GRLAAVEEYTARGGIHQRAQLAHRQRARGLRSATWPQPAGAGVQLAAARSGGAQRDRGGDLTRAGRAEHRGGRFDALAGGFGGDRSDYARIKRHDKTTPHASRRSAREESMGRILAAIAIVLLSAAAAAAQSDYPSKPVKIIVNVSAGGGVD